MIDKENSVLVEQHTLGLTVVRIFIDRTSGKFWTSGLKHPVVYSDLLQLRRQVEFVLAKKKAAQ